MHTTGSRERLARQVSGAVLDGSDPVAAAEAAGFNTAVTHSPSVVVAAESADDVAAAVRYATEVGSRVAVQATGHGAAHAVDGAVLVTTARMQGVRVDPVDRTARVEAGVRWRSVIDAAVPHGLAPLSGLVVGRRRGRLHPRGRDGPPRAAPRLRRRPRPRRRAGGGRRASSAGSPPRATPSCSGRCAADRAGSGSPPRWSSTWCRSPSSSEVRWSSAQARSSRCCAPSPRGRRRCRRRSPRRSRCCACPRSRRCRHPCVGW